jgi:NAD(P)H dehydrogenase (quinone)
MSSTAHRPDVFGDDINVAVIYYSSTGSVHALAEAVCEGAEKAGARTRLRRVAELAPAEAVAANPAWTRHVEATADVPLAEHEDLIWADAVVLGSPTRFGLPAAQLKQFIDTTGGLWAKGLLADKVYAAITSTGTSHGGQETTLLAMANTFYHWGGVLVPPGFSDPIQFAAGNPYGASHVDDNGKRDPGGVELDAARFLGRRVTTVAARFKAGTAATAAGSGDTEPAVA